MAGMSDRSPPKNDERWRHWKYGTVYVVTEVSKDEAAPHTIRVAYRNPEAPPDQIPWSRTLEDFMAVVPVGDVIALIGCPAALNRFERVS